MAFNIHTIRNQSGIKIFLTYYKNGSMAQKYENIALILRIQVIYDIVIFKYTFRMDKNNFKINSHLLSAYYRPDTNPLKSNDSFTPQGKFMIFIVIVSLQR